MEALPGMGQQTQQQQVQAPVQMPGQAEPQQGTQPYPATEAEAMQFSNDIMQVMYDEQMHENTMKQLSSVGDQDKVHSVGAIAANTVGDRITDVKAQTGRPIEMELATGAVESVIKELSQMAAGNGLFEMTPEEQVQSVQTALGILDGLGQSGQGGQV